MELLVIYWFVYFFASKRIINKSEHVIPAKLQQLLRMINLKNKKKVPSMITEYFLFLV